MRAIRICGIGDALQQREVPRPSPGTGEVLVKISAAGICHSDVHYADGISPVARLPITPGHEIAGVVADLGPGTRDPRPLEPGDRVCLHYLVTCGDCSFCQSGRHQWCGSAEMIGKDRDGGYAEYIVVPTRNAIPIPEGISDEHAAVMMCSSATSLHALRKARIQAGETVAIFGCGGLGSSAIQIARILGAGLVIGVDLDPNKLALAERFGARPVDATSVDPVKEIMKMTDGAGVDVVLELVGVGLTVRQSISSAGIGGRVALVGIVNETIPVNPYTELIVREVELIGVSDHYPEEIRELLDWTAAGQIDLGPLVARSIDLDLQAVEEVFSALRRGTAPPRTVIRISE